MPNRKDRGKGAFIGALIGEALGVGPHWYYDLSKMKDAYGPWIDSYTEPKKGRYHEGLKAGELSQQGWLMKEMASYLVAHQGYDASSFCKMMDEHILPQLDGKAMGGKGGYTSQVMLNIYKKRVVENADWSSVASISDTTESLERNIPTAIYYANNLEKLSKILAENTALTQSDNVTGSLSVAFNLVLAMIINGEPFDEDISKKLMKKEQKGDFAFYSDASPESIRPKSGLYASPDALLSPGYMARAAKDPDINIEPPWKVSLVYGMPCAIYHLLPATYYLAARFHNDFESGVLHALNGGGQNQIRAMLTGALIGASVGFEAIPKRFIEGLVDHDLLIDLANKLSKDL